MNDSIAVHPDYFTVYSSFLIKSKLMNDLKKFLSEYHKDPSMKYNWHEVTKIVRVFFRENTPTDYIPDFDSINDELIRESIYISPYDHKNYSLLADIIYAEHGKYSIEV